MKKLLVFLAAMSLVFGVVGAAGADSYLGNDYSIVPATTYQYNWTEADSEAIVLGGHLATVGDAAEWAFIQTLSGFGSHLWLGGSQDSSWPDYAADPAADWSWVDGTPWVFTAWAPNEPNDVGWSGYPDGEDGDENYLITWTGGWNDEDNSSYCHNHGFILEIEGVGVPEPATMLLLGSGLLGLAGLGRKKFFKK